MAQTGACQALWWWELPHLSRPRQKWHLGCVVRGEQCQGGDIPREVAVAAHRAWVPLLTR